MPPSPAGADAVLTASTRPARLDASLLRLARLTAGARPEAVLHEVVATLGVSAASLWDVDPEHGIPGRTAWLRADGNEAADTAGDAGLPAVMRLFDGRVDLHSRPRRPPGDRPLSTSPTPGSGGPAR